VTVVGKEYMDAPGAKIFASNHTSYFDVLPLMIGLGVPYRFVAKMEVGRMPFIGTFLKQMGHLKFDRTDAESRLRQAQEIEGFLRTVNLFLFFRRDVYERRRRASISVGRIQSGCSNRCADHSRFTCGDAEISARWNLLAAAE